jgi:pimeloyl-ACP methyl ester carboxylesterase
MKVIFAHGFEGSTTGSKPTYMKNDLRWDVNAVNMPKLGWNIENQTQNLLEAIDSTPDLELLVGSSMGGLAAANASQLRPERKFKVILLAPAFGLQGLWEDRLDEAQMTHWQETQSYNYVGFDLNIFLGWDFMRTAKRMSWPIVAHPTAIIHGREDTVVPIGNSRRAAELSPAIQSVMEVDDEHRLKNSIPCIPSAFELLV